MKNTIRVSNLTLDLYLDYVLPAAIKAGIVEEISINGGKDHTAEELVANEIETCMRCACFNAGHDGVQRNHEEYIAHEADEMIYQLEVSIKYCKDTETVKALEALLNAMTATEETENKEEEKTMFNNTTIQKAYEIMMGQKARSAWAQGVRAYAIDMIEQIDDAISGGWFDAGDLAAPKILSKALLNGADNWSMARWGGSWLCYDGEIAERLCTPSELKKARNGQRRPNSREEWLDVQARALYQAEHLVMEAVAQAVSAQ